MAGYYNGTFQNPGMMNGFYNPYAQQTPPAQSNVLPPQQVLQANGKASVDALRMSPNSSVLIMDTTAPLVWLCTSDSLGNVTAAPYDIALHQDAPAPDMQGFEARLAAVENSVSGILAKWEESNNGKQSDARGGKSKQSGRDDGDD